MQTGKGILIPSILKVGNGTLKKIGQYLKAENLEQVVIFFGNGLIDLFGMDVMDSLKQEGITVLEYSELDTVDIDDIITLAFAMPNKTQAVISIGGGKVIDAGKYAAFLRNIPFISVPTSSSSDGFSSASASLLVHGKRTSVPAKLAYGIIVDTQVIRTAPDKFIYSGIGDMISKITALYDWIFEEKSGYSEVNDFAVMIAKKAVNSFVRTPYETIKDELFLKELVDSLAMSGIANEIAGSSAPTSGSEHLISHALDKILEVPQLHGIQVGIATYIMSKVQDHRYVRVETVLRETGFFDYAATLGMKCEDFTKRSRWLRRSNHSAILISMRNHTGSLQRRLFWRMRCCRRYWCKEKYINRNVRTFISQNTKRGKEKILHGYIGHMDHFINLYASYGFSHHIGYGT